MHRFLIKAVGTLPKDWHAQAIHTHLERLAPFAKVEIIECPEGHRGTAKPDARKTKSEEALSLLSNLPKDATVVVLDETGTNLDSTTFAKKLDTWTAGGRTVVFLIGGSWGLDASVLERADFRLSFGKQTFPHLLARIVLLEQLYRAETILHGKVYHK